MEGMTFNGSPEIKQCAMCGEKFQPHELTSIDGEFVCDDCLHDFCEEK